MFINRMIQPVLRLSTSKNVSIFLKLADLRVHCPVSVRSLSQSSHSKQGASNIKPTDITVYYGTLTPQIRAVKVFSWLTSIMGVAVQPMLYTQLLELNSVPMFVVIYSFVGFFTLVTPFLLHALTKKYITHLIYKPDVDKYEATTINFFMIPKKVQFSLDDVTVPEIPGIFTTFVVNGKGLFVDPRLFQHPAHFGKIMGYDKPLDLKLYKTSLNESDNRKK